MRLLPFAVVLVSLPLLLAHTWTDETPLHPITVPLVGDTARLPAYYVSGTGDTACAELGITAVCESAITFDPDAGLLGGLINTLACDATIAAGDTAIAGCRLP